MFGKQGETKVSGAQAVTLIGAGVRVEGQVNFTGILRVQGDIVGDVMCAGEGTVVIMASGSVTGKIEAPNILVGGLVRGPVRALQSIEIQRGGSVVGDASYRNLLVHAGGLLEGALQPMAPVAEVRSVPPRAIIEPVMPQEVVQPSPAAVAMNDPARRWRNRRLAGVAAVLVASVTAAVWLYREPGATLPASATAAEPVATEKVAASDPAPATPPAKTEAPTPKADPAPVMVAVAASPEKPAEKPVEKSAEKPAEKPAPPPEPAEPVVKQREADGVAVVTIQGEKANKPSDAVFVAAREHAVLFKRQRDGAGDGKPVDIARGKRVRVPLARGEVLRVAEGRHVELFYQGRRVPPRTVDSGAWIAFVPQTP